MRWDWMPVAASRPKTALPCCFFPKTCRFWGAKLPGSPRSTTSTLDCGAGWWYRSCTLFIYALLVACRVSQKVDFKSTFCNTACDTGISPISGQNSAACRMSQCRNFHILNRPVHAPFDSWYTQTSVIRAPWDRRVSMTWICP